MHEAVVPARAYVPATLLCRNAATPRKCPESCGSAQPAAHKRSKKTEESPFDLAVTSQLSRAVKSSLSRSEATSCRNAFENIRKDRSFGFFRSKK
jgi:hypothetical protein